VRILLLAKGSPLKGGLKSSACVLEEITINDSNLVQLASKEPAYRRQV